VKVQEILRDIINVGELPNKLEINNDWNVALLLSDFDNVSNQGYVPQLMFSVDVGLREHEILLGDLDIDRSASTQYQLHDTEVNRFDSACVDEYIEKTGAFNILVEFTKLPCFILGLDREVILIVFKKIMTFSKV